MRPFLQRGQMVRSMPVSSLSRSRQSLSSVARELTCTSSASVVGFVFSSSNWRATTSLVVALEGGH